MCPEIVGLQLNSRLASIWIMAWILEHVKKTFSSNPLYMALTVPFLFLVNFQMFDVKLLVEDLIYWFASLVFLRSVLLHFRLFTNKSLSSQIFQIFFALAVIGQMVANPKLTYPFPNWGMYASRAPKAEFNDYLGTLDSGRIISYPFAQLFPAYSPRAAKNIFSKRLDSDSLEVLLNHYNKNFHSDKMQVIERVTYRLNLGQGPSSSRVDVQRVEAK
jgi:hypothetical protein